MPTGLVFTHPHLLVLLRGWRAQGLQSVVCEPGDHSHISEAAQRKEQQPGRLREQKCVVPSP